MNRFRFDNTESYTGADLKIGIAPADVELAKEALPALSH